MKLYQFIFIILFSISFYNCYEEGNIVAEESPYKREQMYDTNSNNKVIQFVSRYYYQYDRFFITDPDSSDYLYNFGGKNEDLQITPPKQDNEHIWKGIETVKTLLLDAYSKEFIHDHFPYSLILTDETLEPIFEEPADYYTGRYFCMIRIQYLNDMTQNEKEYNSSKLHEMIWFYIGLYDEFIKLPAEFYKFGEGYYGEMKGLWSPEKRYQYGFASNKVPDDWGMTWFPSKGEDIGSWIGFLLQTPDDELQKILDTYEAMRIKYKYLVTALEAAGIDYHKLRYTEK